MYAARTGYRKAIDQELSTLHSENEALKKENERLRKDNERLRKDNEALLLKIAQLEGKG